MFEDVDISELLTQNLGSGETFNFTLLNPQPAIGPVFDFDGLNMDFCATETEP
jgi:hypothetical protein